MEKTVFMRPFRNADVCTMCGICELFCPSLCITAGDDDESWFDYACCKGCNMCETVCPEEAIEMKLVMEEVIS